MAERPTDTAKNFFTEAIMLASSYKNTKNEADLGHAVQKLAQGLYFQSVGQRATYMLLEEVKALLVRGNEPRSTAGALAKGVAAGMKSLQGR